MAIIDHRESTNSVVDAESGDGRSEGENRRFDYDLAVRNVTPTNVRVNLSFAGLNPKVRDDGRVDFTHPEVMSLPDLSRDVELESADPADRPTVRGHTRETTLDLSRGYYRIETIADTGTATVVLSVGSDGIPDHRAVDIRVLPEDVIAATTQI